MLRGWSNLVTLLFDKAIAALAQIVNSKHSDETRADKSLESIAKIHLQIGLAA